MIQKNIIVFKKLYDLVAFLKIELRKNQISFNFNCTPILFEYIKLLKIHGLFLNFIFKIKPYYDNKSIYHVTILLQAQSRYLEHSFQYVHFNELQSYNLKTTGFMSIQTIQKLVNKNKNVVYIFSTFKKNEILSGQSLIKHGHNGGFLNISVKF